MEIKHNWGNARVAKNSTVEKIAYFVQQEELHHLGIHKVQLRVENYKKNDSFVQKV